MAGDWIKKRVHIVTMREIFGVIPGQLALTCYNYNQESRETNPQQESKMATAKLIENDGQEWFELNGIDYGTGYEFDNDTYAISVNGQILDADGFPLTEGDHETIAVRNQLQCP